MHIGKINYLISPKNIDIRTQIIRTTCLTNYGSFYKYTHVVYNSTIFIVVSLVFFSFFFHLIFVLTLRLCDVTYVFFFFFFNYDSYK